MKHDRYVIYILHKV